MSVPRSSFDRFFSHKTTFDSGLLIPIYVDEVLPGDTVNLRPAFFARMATPLKPYMDGIHLDYQYFQVPLRLVFTNFVRMMGERPTPSDHNDYTIPQMVAPTSPGYTENTLSDYMGLPTEVPDYTHSSLFHRSYNLIYNEWYRDENLVDPVVVDLDDGPDDPADYVLRRRGKRKDYFSGALPFLQKGDAITLSLGTSAPISGPIDTSGDVVLGTIAGGSDTKLERILDNGVRAIDVGDGSTLGDFRFGGTTGLEIGAGATADLTGATAITINSMRQALGIQHLLEIDARGGTRYRETLLSHFGVISDDIRLLRPELLCTGSVPVNVHPVASTTQISTDPLGSLAAFATAQTVGRGFMKTFKEHSILMGIISVRAELSYQQGLHRMWTRKTRYEFFWPSLANLGEQVVQSREIYTDGTGDETAMTGDFSVWGYQPRYEEYRHRTSMITGEMRSNFSASLDVWHLALDFSSRPVLNEAFIEENPPIDRVIRVQIPSAPQFLLDSFMKITHVRPMPKYSTPGLTRF